MHYPFSCLWYHKIIILWDLLLANVQGKNNTGLLGLLREHGQAIVGFRLFYYCVTAVGLYSLHE